LERQDYWSRFSVDSKGTRSRLSLDAVKVIAANLITLTVRDVLDPYHAESYKRDG